jgi:hypothetical protein
MKTEETNVTHSFPNDEVLAAIGKITLSHAWLDNALRMTVMDLAGVTKDEALDGTARQGSRELRERVRRLGKTRLGEGPALVKLDAILRRAERATEQRNHLLHSVWGRNLDRDGNFLREPDHSFRPAPTAKELEKLSAEILDVVYSIITARLDGFLQVALKKRPLREP